MVYDKLSYFLANLNLAVKQKKLCIVVDNIKIIRKVLPLLQKLGYVQGFVVSFESGKISVNLKYNEAGVSAIRGLIRVSRPSARVYASYTLLKKFARNNNLSNTYQNIILSTPKGVMSHASAVKTRVGGEILFLIN